MNIHKFADSLRKLFSGFEVSISPIPSKSEEYYESEVTIKATIPIKHNSKTDEDILIHQIEESFLNLEFFEEFFQEFTENKVKADDIKKMA